MANAVLSLKAPPDLENEIRGRAMESGRTISDVLKGLVVRALELEQDGHTGEEMDREMSNDFEARLADLRVEAERKQAEAERRFDRLEQALRESKIDEEQIRTLLDDFKRQITSQIEKWSEVQKVASSDEDQVKTILDDFKRQITSQVDGLRDEARRAASDALEERLRREVGPGGHVSKQRIREIVDCPDCRKVVGEVLLADGDARRYCIGSICRSSPGELARALAELGPEELADKLSAEDLKSLGETCEGGYCIKTGRPAPGDEKFSWITRFGRKSAFSG